MTAQDSAGPDRPQKNDLTQAAADKLFEERRRKDQEEAARIETKMLLFNKMLGWKQTVVSHSQPGTADHARLVKQCGEATELFFRVIGGIVDTQKFAAVSQVFEGNPSPSPDEVIDRLRKL